MHARQVRHGDEQNQTTIRNVEGAFLQKTHIKLTATSSPPNASSLFSAPFRRRSRSRRSFRSARRAAEGGPCAPEEDEVPPSIAQSRVVVFLRVCWLSLLPSKNDGKF
jgi:hypothetical protein